MLTICSDARKVKNIEEEVCTDFDTKYGATFQKKCHIIYLYIYLENNSVL